MHIYSDGKINDINEENRSLPENYELYKNFPNPFNSSTIIRYSIPKREQVTIKIYDLLGRLITTLVNKNEKAGEHRSELNTNNLSSRVYFYQFIAEKYISSKTMLLFKGAKSPPWIFKLSNSFRSSFVQLRKLLCCLIKHLIQD